MNLSQSFKLVRRACLLVLSCLVFQVTHATEWIPAPTPITVVSTGNAGSNASMTTVNGNPAIAYFLGAPDNDLVYVRANDALGTTWGTPVVVQSTATVGRFSQLLVVNGNPAIAYRNSSGAGLSYVRATDANGSSWGTPVSIGGSAVSDISMALVAGRPAIAYYDNFFSLNYVRANDADGASWGTPLVLDSSTPNGTGKNASLAVINGNPAIGYQRQEGTGSQKFIRATDSTGSAWGTALVVDAAGVTSTGGESDLAEVNGRPAMTYQRDNNLYYVRANDANGATWGTPQNLAPTARFTSLTVISGFPAISYLKFDTGDLRYIRASNTDGTAWNPIVEVDNSANNVGRYSQLEVIAGHPAIAYQDETAGDLKYVRAPNPVVVSYTVTASAGANGSLVCASPVNGGSTTTCTATPNPGYRTASISGCGGSATGVGVNAYTTGVISANCTVTATFGLITLIINELDSDNPATDVAEFIELYDGGVGNTPLDGLVLVLYNGSNDLSYAAFDLDGQSTRANGHFVLCGNAANVANCDLDVNPNSDLIQNGQDAAALFRANAADFPNNTAVTTTNLVDAIVYDTSDDDDPGLLVLLNPSQPQVDENANANAANESNQRCPNGSGGARNTSTYQQASPSPGASNTCPVADLTVTKIANGPFQQGGTASFTVTVTNSGTGPTTSSYTMTDAMPTGLTAGLVTSPEPGWNCTASTSTNVSCTRTTALAASASTTLTIPVSIAGNAPISITNTANISGGGEVVTNNNSGSVTVNVTPPINLTINDVTANEGNSGTTSFTFNVSLSPPAGPGGVTFDIATANGAATAGSDYVANSLTSQTIPAASSSYSFTVLVNGDALNEVAETFFVNVTNVTGAIIGDGQGVGTITNDDPLPTLSINDISVTEGSSGTTNAGFTVTLNAASGQTVQVNYATAEGTATQPADYVNNSGTLTFTPGQTTQPITVLVQGDTAVESNESYFVNLSGAVNATIVDNQGLGTIVDDDCPSTVVTNGDDSGAGSLRQIIADACAGSTITFAPALSTVTLTTAQLLINKNLTIDGGTGVTITRSSAGGTPNFRIFEVTSGSTVVFDSLTLSNGTETVGGIIRNLGNLTIQDTVISGGTASADGGGIYNENGMLQVSNSTITGNVAGNVAGGILNVGFSNAASAIIINSSVVENRAAFAAGMQNQGATLSLTNCTIANNEASGADPAGDGAGLVNVGAGFVTTATLTNCTFNGNRQLSAVSPAADDVYSGNFGTQSTVTLKNSILGGSAATATPNLGIHNGGVITSQGNNLSSDSGAGVLTGPGDLPNMNPLLAPLGNYGGTTQTQALLPGSPAINAGNNSGAPTTDQRGIARVGTVDIGAFESRGFTLTRTSGDAQTAVVNTAFAAPLVTTVSSAFSEPVQDGLVTFAVPGSGASAALSSASATIAANGQASTIATANGSTGNYNVSANASGNLGSALSYALTNRDLSADLSISKTNGTASSIPGGSTTYTITASNAGLDPVIGATVLDTFPASLTCTWTCVGAGGGTCPVSGSGNISSLVNLPVGASVTFTASCAISAAATGTLSNTATVSSSIADPASGNNSFTDTDTLTPQADVSITKTDGQTSVDAGTSTTYTITASNAGPSNAPGTTVADTFPAACTSVTWTCAGAGGGTCTANGSGNINDTVNLPSGGSVAFSAICAISTTATGTLSNTATVTLAGGINDSAPGNNSATDTNTINDFPTLAINDVSISEGNSDTATLNFTVTRTGTTASAVGFSFATADDTATASSDYVTATGTGTIPAGGATGSTQVSVTINGDAVFENTERFFVNLTAPTNATIADNQGIGTITNDDTAPTLAINDVSITEGNFGTQNLVFTVTRTGLTALPASFTATTANGTATAGSDYVALLAGSTTIAAGGATGTTTLTATINGDAVVEANETFLVNLTAPANATIADNQAIGTITNDDSAGVVITQSGGSTEVTEGGTTDTLTLVLTAEPTSDITITFNVGAQVSFASNPLVITPSQWNVPQTVTVSAVDDAVVEGPHSATVGLIFTGDSNFAAITPNSISQLVLITDNDQQPTTTTINSDLPDPSVVGQAYPVSVTVTAQSSSPTGSVMVSDGTASCTATLSSGAAPNSAGSCNLTSTTAGAKTLTASYTAATTDFGNSSGSTDHQVNPAATTISVSGPARSRINQPTAFSFALTVTSPGGGTPTGTVTLSSGAANCTATLPVTSCNLTFTTLGSRTVTASYAGDGNYSASASSGAGNMQTLVFALSNMDVSKNSAGTTFRPGELLVYTVQVRNLGPDAAQGIRVRDQIPAGLSNTVWSCDASGGVACPVTGGSGDLDTTTGAYPVSGLLTFTFYGTAQNVQQILNQALLELPADTTVEDPATSNNNASDLDQNESIFRDGLEDPLVNTTSGAYRLPGLALRSVVDEVAAQVYRLDDVRGTALQIYARQFGGQMQYALALRGPNGFLSLSAWQTLDGEPLLQWTATPEQDGYRLQSATLR